MDASAANMQRLAEAVSERTVNRVIAHSQQTLSVIKEVQQRAETAEKRAEAAEKRVEELTREYAVLRMRHRGDATLYKKAQAQLEAQLAAEQEKNKECAARIKVLQDFLAGQMSFMGVLNN